jgi:integrase
MSSTWVTTEDRSAHVVNDVWLRAARTVVQWAVVRKRLPLNPFSGATVALPKRPPKLREREFLEAEWRTILKATLEPPPARIEPYNAAARRWVSWICAYTGSRPGEATQLRGEDIAQHSEGFWTMRITPEAGDVKGNTARTVPLHEHLIEQGFVTFAKAKAKGKGPLFYDPGVGVDPVWWTPLKLIFEVSDAPLPNRLSASASSLARGWGLNQLADCFAEKA